MVSLSSYPDPVTRADAAELQKATSFVFSLDDLQGTWEPSLWQDMLNFVKNSSAKQHRLYRKDHAGPGHGGAGPLAHCDSNEAARARPPSYGRALARRRTGRRLRWR